VFWVVFLVWGLNWVAGCPFGMGGMRLCMLTQHERHCRVLSVMGAAIFLCWRLGMLRFRFSAFEGKAFEIATFEIGFGFSSVPRHASIPVQELEP
jgi:hypothetical protein